MPPTNIRDIHRRLSINTASNMGRFVVNTAITIFLTPFIVRTLGDSLYGFWALLISFIGYASLLEMGVQPAVVKLVGQYRAVGQTEKLRELVTSAFVFFLGVGAVAAALALTVLPSVVENHVEDLRLLPRPGLLFGLIALDAMVVYMNYLVTGILYGSQKYHIKNLIDISGRVITAALLVLFLERWGILTMIGAKLVVDVFVACVSTFAIGRIAPELRLNPSLLRRDSFKELMGFGGKVFISATTSRLAGNAPPLIISTAVSSAALAIYVIPGRLIGYTEQIAWTLSASFMPMFSELDSKGERDTMRRIYLDYSRYIFTILMPFMVGLFVYGAPFIGIWIGPNYAEEGRTVLLLLTGRAFMDNAQPLLWRFFIGVGELNLLIRISAVMSILAVLASIALVIPLGIDGVALGFFAGAVVGKSLLAVQSCRQLDMSVGALLRSVHLRPTLAGLVMLGMALAVSKFVGNDSYVKILGGGAACAVVYAGLAYRFAVTPDERRALQEVLARKLRR